MGSTFRRRAAAAAVLLAAGLLAPVAAVPAGAQTPPPSVDYDADGDGLIEIASLSQLNAVRFDLDGDGAADVYPPSKDGRTGHDPDGATKYAAAFPNAAAGMGCPTDGCDGYELAADLDFDTNGNGSADAGDEFWNEGKGWVPIFGGEAIYSYSQDNRFADRFRSAAFGRRPHARARMFTAQFEGNGRTIANLRINRPGRWYVGLFGYIGPGAHVRNLGLTAPNADSRVRGNAQAGALAGALEEGRVSGVWSEVAVRGYSSVGGLVGWHWDFGLIIESYATGAVAGTYWVGGLVGLVAGASVAAVYATGDVTASHSAAGGLVGHRSFGHIRATYATGAVTVTRPDDGKTNPPAVGGLIGRLTHPWEFAWMRANYAAGSVSGTRARVTGGLTGVCLNSERPRAEGSNYWDTEASGQTTSPECGVGYTTAELQAPTGYEGIYAHWNVDVDVDDYDGPFDGPIPKTSLSHPRKADSDEAARDDPWDFGTSGEYPVLKYCAAKPGIDTADGLPYCPLQPWRQRGQPEPDPPSAAPDPPVLPVASVAGDGSVGEGSFAVFTLTVAPPPSGGLVVQVTVRSSDFGVLSQTRVVRVPVSGTAKVYVATAVDYDSVDGWVTVSVDDDPEDTAAYAASATRGAATVTVLDND